MNKFYTKCKRNLFIHFKILSDNSNCNFPIRKLFIEIVRVKRDFLIAPENAV